MDNLDKMWEKNIYKDIDTSIERGEYVQDLLKYAYLEPWEREQYEILATKYTEQLRNLRAQLQKYGN